MRKIIHYALHQPLFIVLGTVLFAMAGFFLGLDVKKAA